MVQKKKLPSNIVLTRLLRWDLMESNYSWCRWNQMKTVICKKIKRQAYHAGLDLMGFSTHQGFVYPDKEKRDSEIKKTIHQIELAYALGIPTMRLNTGRWGTIKSFDDFMANQGKEPVLEGYTE